MKYLLACLGFICGVDFLSAQTVTASLGNLDTVRQGEVVQLTVRFDDLEPPGFELPEPVGLRVVGGPSRMSQMSIVNGKRSSSASFTFYLQADEAGLASVPEMELNIDGEDYVTDALAVFVTDDPSYVPVPAAGFRDEVPAPRRKPRPTVRM